MQVTASPAFALSALLSCLVSSGSDAFVEPESGEDAEDAEGPACRLWVDRFSPRHYTELLSDDVSGASLKRVSVNLLRSLSFDADVVLTVH